MEPGWTVHHDFGNLTDIILALLAPSIHQSESQGSDVSSQLFVSAELNVADTLAAYLFSYFSDPLSLRISSNGTGEDDGDENSAEEAPLIDTTTFLENGFSFGQSPVVSDDSPAIVSDELWSVGLWTDGFDPQAIMQAMEFDAAEATSIEQVEDFS